METRLLQTAIRVETDIVLVRKQTRRLAELVGFDPQDQTRITTAVSEIARNAFDYAGGGKVDFRLAASGTGDGGRQQFVVQVQDKGPGIADLDAVLAGLRTSPTSLGVGLTGAQRLMDDFRVDTTPARGTQVRLAKYLPKGSPPLTGPDIRRLADALAADGPADPMEEIRRQNHQILLQMEELRQRHEDLGKLNQELQDTNRGVVALYAELDERADHLRRADELKSRFLSHMSHEFRTPVNSILALSRLLISRNDGELTAEQEKQVYFIRKAAEDLIELVNDLLDLAKVEAGKTVVTPSAFTVDSLFGTLRGMLRPLLAGDAVALVFDENPNLPALHTDEGKVSQILRNFISNAIKFTERGEVRVWASTTPPPRAGTASPLGGTISFFVHDSGIGIAPEDIEVIFEEFGQISHHLQARVKGTGLGLPLSRKLAELLDGYITVDSTPGQGSTFAVTIPLVHADAGTPPGLMPQWDIQPDKRPVLLAGEDPCDTGAVERILAGSAYQPVPVGTAETARQSLSRLRPAAVILDASLAGDESWQFLFRHEQTAPVPVIVTSSDPGALPRLDVGLVASGPCGADAYLPKPLLAGRLLPLLDRLTGPPAAIRALVLDDEEVARYLTRQLLPAGRYSLRLAATGQQALECLADELPDIILLDLHMPDMDGRAFLARLHASPSWSRIPVLLVTSAILDTEERRQLGNVAAVIPKSELSTERLEDAIQDALSAAATPVQP